MPLPLDPVTGNPFAYSVDGTTAHIRGESLPEKGKSPRPGRSLQCDHP